MKAYKQEIVDRIVNEAEGCRIVRLHDIGTELGHKHISTQDCLDIIYAVQKALPDYKCVKFVNPGQSSATASLWMTATFLDRDVEFDDGWATV